VSFTTRKKKKREEDDLLSQGKAFEIPKILVWQSYQEVRKNRGAPGCDGETITQFNRNRNRNLYKIWNRLSSGSYFPAPVLEKAIPKGDGRERVLGIPTVTDRIAQGAVKIYLEQKLDRIFHKDSYGYRPGKSAHQALQVTKERCWRYSWILEVDIKGFFDNVRHDLMVKALEYHGVPNWVLLYCKRWLRGPKVNRKGQISERDKGIPQGGVISPLLANLFLHYAIDTWIERKHRHVLFARYADDLVLHCNRMSEALRLKLGLGKRLKEVGLEMNEEKSKVVYIDTFKRRKVATSFTFLGYDFKVRNLKRADGEYFRKVMPGASKKALKQITKIVKGWRLHRSSGETLKELAKRYNATIRGWIEYYGKFWYWNFNYHLWSVVQSRLVKWVKNKYRSSQRKAEARLARLRTDQPNLFAHWYLFRPSNV
jgi:RNA-directed DNA polymerase